MGNTDPQNPRTKHSTYPPETCGPSVRGISVLTVSSPLPRCCVHLNRVEGGLTLLLFVSLETEASGVGTGSPCRSRSGACGGAGGAFPAAGCRLSSCCGSDVTAPCCGHSGDPVPSECPRRSVAECEAVCPQAALVLPTQRGVLSWLHPACPRPRPLGFLDLVPPRLCVCKYFINSLTAVSKD